MKSKCPETVTQLISRLHAMTIKLVLCLLYKCEADAACPSIG